VNEGESFYDGISRLEAVSPSLSDHQCTGRSGMFRL